MTMPPSIVEIPAKNSFTGLQLADLAQARVRSALATQTRAVSPHLGGRSEISYPLPIIAIISCYLAAMIRFIFGLDIRLATFIASAVAVLRKPEAGLRARHRRWGSVVAIP